MLHLNVFRASVVALALGLSSPAGPACACSCLPTDPAEQVDKADVIFIGRVERVGPAGQIGDRPIGATIFRVERVLKGEAGTWVAVRHQSGDSTLCGCCQVNWVQSKVPLPCKISGYRRHPSGIRIGAKTTKCGSADEMALDIEGVVNRRVGGEKSLG